MALVKIDRKRSHFRNGIGDHRRLPGFLRPRGSGSPCRLIVPAVQTARNETASESKIHLKTVGLALANYSDTFGSFPPRSDRRRTQREHHGWQVMLLPYLDQQAVYVQVNFKVPWNAPENVKPFQMQIKDFQQPSIDDEKRQHRLHLEPLRRQQLPVSRKRWGPNTET